jgi:acetylornithine deacetylase
MRISLDWKVPSNDRFNRTAKFERVMMNNEMVDKISAAVEEGFEEQTSFLRRLVRIPSQMGSEQNAQDLVAKELRKRDYSVDQWRIDEDHIAEHPGYSPNNIPYENSFNVVGTHRPRQERGRSLILNGHIDVVPVGPLEQWSSSPYDARIEGDWLHGRGSGDMKAGLSANIFAVDALKRLGYQPASTVYQQSVVEEECTGNGTLACLVRGYDAEAAIITEPMGEQLCRTSTGILWFTVRVIGTPAHTSAPGKGSNAIESAYNVIGMLKRLESDWNQRKSNYPLFSDLERPIYLNVGRIRGGDWPSSLPAWCEIDCRVNIYPGIDPTDAKNEIINFVREEALKDPALRKHLPELRFVGQFNAGYELPQDSEAEKVLKEAHTWTVGSDLKEFSFTGYLDATVYTIYGERPCLVYGPKAENIHSFDERVNLPSVRRVTKTLAIFIAEWCGLEAL